VGKGASGLTVFPGALSASWRIVIQDSNVCPSGISSGSPTSKTTPGLTARRVSPSTDPAVSIRHPDGGVNDVVSDSLNDVPPCSGGPVTNVSG